MMPGSKKQDRAHAGFTIVELLVATAVTAVLIGLMITMTNGVLTAWNRTSGTLTANNQGKIALDLIAEDLQSAMFRYDSANFSSAWFAVEVLDQIPGGRTHNLGNHGWVLSGAGHSSIIKPTRQQENRGFVLTEEELANCRYGQGGTWLRFFSHSSAAGINDQSNQIPTAISYQIVRRHVTGNPSIGNPAEVRYMLVRSEFPHVEQLERGYDLDWAAPSPNLYDNVGGSSSPLLNPSNAGIVANNVIDFGVRLYVRRPVGVPPGLDTLYPVRNFAMDDFVLDDDPQYLATGSDQQPFPDVVDIMVRVLTEEGARQIQNLEAGRTFQHLSNAEKYREWWDIAEANSRVFTRRVYLNSRPY